MLILIGAFRNFLTWNKSLSFPRCICAVAVHNRSAEKSPGIYDCSLLRLSSAWQPVQRTWARWGHMISGVKVSRWSAGGRSSPQTHCQIANISLSLQGFWGSRRACLAIMRLCGNICVWVGGQLTLMQYKFVGESLLPSKSCWAQTPTSGSYTSLHITLCSFADKQ